MLQVPEIITGNIFSDHRGALTSCNDFNMQEVRRMYIIKPRSCDTIRAWQAHKEEKKWFLCISGTFEVKVIKVDDFSNPSSDLSAISHVLCASTPKILYVPGGYANGFKSTEEGSQLMVFSSFSLSDSSNDDYRFDEQYWNVWTN